ncbi:uncharacterized protein LOC135090141 isoform X2 [Scylla paramamosain]|uniref:uncharacterized protein LOC135090141 isoform X2 n=1 Tax=Scylla paramamosain TaxID=85552 RepID=UPI003082AA54
MGKQVISTKTPHHLSSAQEDVLHLWPIVTLCKSKSKHGMVRVVQKTSNDTLIVPQRLRNHCISEKNNSVKKRAEKKLATKFRGERTKCSYGLRTWAFSTYMDTDVQHDDDVTYCRQCQKHFFGVCFLHSKLVFNREVVRDGSVEERARLTTPWPLYVAVSHIPGAGEGVWTSAALPRGLVFGPYEGQLLRVKKNSKAADSGYAWHLQVKSYKKSKMYIDSVNKSISNWLRYVNCARDAMEMNLEAFQYKKDIYYITLREIESNSELLVWYGDEYGRELGIVNLSNCIINMPPAQGDALNSEEPEKSPASEETKVNNKMNSSEIKPMYGEQTQKIGKLTKPQSALQHLFCLARLERKDDHSVRVVYVNSIDNNRDSSGDAGRKLRMYGDKPHLLPNVRFNQKYNCKYNHAYCIECRKTYSNPCPKHPMTLILDVPVPRDGSFQNRAELTAPWPLYIAKSKVEDGGLGVWTSADLPQGLVFGPCEGQIVRRTGEMSGYAWEIRGRPDLEIDCKDTSVSNWGRYVNCARNYIERNLIAMQIQNEIFYVTNTEIKRNTELMVWYGASYGQMLGLSTRDFFKPQLRELERWCSECQVLFTSPEFLNRHKERCGQNVRGKSKKRTQDDSDLLPPKHLKSERKPQRKNKKKTSVRNLEGSFLLEARNAVSQTKDLCDISSTDVNCFSSSDQFIAPSFISKQSFHGKKTKISENNVSQRLCHKPGCKCGASKKAFIPGKVYRCGMWQDKPHDGSNVSKSSLKTVTFDSHKGSADFVSPDKALPPDADSAMYFAHELKEPYQNALDSHDMPNVTTNLNQIVNLTPVISQDLHGTFSQILEFDSAETVNNASLDSGSAFLDSFLSHDEPFLDSLNLEEYTASQEKSTNDSSGYKSINSSTQSNHCDNLSDNVLNSSLSTSGLRYSHKAECRPQMPCRESTHIDMLCDGENDDEKSKQIFSHVSDDKIYCGTQKKCCPAQLHEWRNCSCSDGMRMINKQHTRETHQKVLHYSESGNCSHPHPSNMLQKNLKRKNLKDTSMQLYWKKRHDIESRWKMSSHSTVERLQIYVRKNHVHGEHVVNRTKASVHPQEPVAAHAEDCIQDEANISADLQQGERNISLSCDRFYGKMSNHEMSHQNVAKENGNYSRQVRPCSTLDCGGEASLSSLYQHNQTLHGGNCGINVANHSSISGSRQIIMHQKENYCARTQPLQSLIKKHEHPYSRLCPRSGGVILYECFKCGKKFASKYNLHEHQYFCM